MASTTQSFAIDKYSFCDVPMSQHDAKPLWNHHAARDHIYLVLCHEGPLEQPSVPGFPYMNKLILKIVWRAEILETINISDVARQRSNYIDFPNIVCMIRNPSLAMKYVNIRNHVLHRMQVRFCKPEDFHAALSAIERGGCPVQLHNIDTQPKIQHHPTLMHGLARPSTANSMLTATSGQIQYQRPSSTHTLDSRSLGINAASMPPNVHRVSLGPQDPHSTPNRQYLSHPQSSQGQQLSFANPNSQSQLVEPTIPEHLGSNPYQYSAVPSYMRSNNNQQTHQRSISTELPSKQFNDQSLYTKPMLSKSNTDPSYKDYYNTDMAVSNIPNPFEPRYQPHLNRDSSTASSFVSRPGTETSMPVSRGTATSAGTLFGHRTDESQSSFNAHQIPPLLHEQAKSTSSHFRIHEDHIEDDVPPPRQLPDFEKLNKVHGDKQLPSSSAAGKLTGLLKSTKSTATTAASLKRKIPIDDPISSSAPVPTKDTDNGTAKKPKTAPKKPAAPPKPRKPKSAAVLSKPPDTLTKPRTKPPSPAKITPAIPSSPPPTVLQGTSASALNAKVQQQSHLKPGSLELARLETLTETDIESLDENLLAQMIHSDEHLKMVQRLERVWAKLGFGVRVKASGIFGDGGNTVDLTTNKEDDDKENP